MSAPAPEWSWGANPINKAREKGADQEWIKRFSHAEQSDDITVRCRP